ncbi:hypothetical protein AB0D32_24175 [Micromonospora sp. NPDC048170]|uniref:hypothetical protein n=1 Tax=Micromonospora sp. NPDC048170 TaxID=3154819 RepID=UPI003410EF91
MRTWIPRRLLAAAVGGTATAVVIAVPTDLIDTPLFGRSVPATWWAWPVLIATAVLSGLLLATYVRPGDAPRSPRAEGRVGTVGGVLSLLAVGCPVCNKLVLLALGTSGAMTWFAPAQPLLAVASIVLLGWALRRRVLGERQCPVPAAVGGGVDR